MEDEELACALRERPVLTTFAGGSSAAGESELRLGDADGCFATVDVNGREGDEDVEGDASGDGCLTCMRERFRLSLSWKAMRIEHDKERRI